MMHSDQEGLGERVRLSAVGITQRYGAAVALDNVSFDVEQGEVHALIGENGAGKSTLVRVLTGALTPSSGRLQYDGTDLLIRSPADAGAAGIGVVHQDYHLFPDLSVAENVAGVVPVRGGRKRIFTDPSRARRVAARLLSQLGVDVDVSGKAAQLGAAERKLVEIARALVQRPRFLLLDEPTAALEPSEASRLLEVVMSLRDSGTGIILVTHRLDDIVRTADRASALRDGRNVGSISHEQLTTRSLTELMVGANVEEHQGPGHPVGEIAVRLTNATLAAGAAPLQIEAARGEIVAVVGLTGSGCASVLGMLVGSAPRADATIELAGRRVRIRNPRDAVSLRIGSAPEDRKRLGLVGPRGVSENMAIASLRRWGRFGFTRRKALQDATGAAVKMFDIRAKSLDGPVGSLSGGNQQKVLLARSVLARAEILVLHEPSQGVDVGARRAIHEYLLGFAADGGTVLFSSTDVDEVRAISHRIYVLHDGEVVAEFDNTGLGRPTRARLTETILSAHDPNVQEKDIA